MPPTAPTPGPAADPKAAAPGARPAVIEGPPEEEFWEKYNKRLEFPLSTVSAVLLHVLVGAVLIFILVRLMDKGQQPDVSVKTIGIGGLDDAGDGSPGSGGDEEFIKSDGNPLKMAQDTINDPARLPDVQDVKQAITFNDQTGALPISDSNLAAYAKLDKAVRDKMLGRREGAGPGAGKGSTGQAGTGVGGTGADSTFARGLRWTLRFRVTDGRNYLAQLKAMGGEILVPVPGTGQCILIRDLDNPENKKVATDAEIEELRTTKLGMNDMRSWAVKEMAQVLRLDFTPEMFWVYFPQSLQDELARKETGYRNRRSEDIAETVFRVTVRGGTYEAVVDEQKVKR